MNRSLRLITPGQPATEGALDIYVEAQRTGHVGNMLIGLSVLSSATVAQIDLAIPVVAARHQVSPAAIAGLLAD
jgi:hypothetical protein